MKILLTPVFPTTKTYISVLANQPVLVFFLKFAFFKDNLDLFQFPIALPVKELLQCEVIFGKQVDFCRGSMMKPSVQYIGFYSVQSCH